MEFRRIAGLPSLGECAWFEKGRPALIHIVLSMLTLTLGNYPRKFRESVTDETAQRVPLLTVGYCATCSLASTLTWSVNTFVEGE